MAHFFVYNLVHFTSHLIKYIILSAKIQFSRRRENNNTPRTLFPNSSHVYSASKNGLEPAIINTFLSHCIVKSQYHYYYMSRLEPDRDAYLRLGQALTQRHSDQLSAQLSVFQSALVNFAGEHGDMIKSNPEFQSKFTQMCHLVGVDPLELLLFVDAKTKKGENFYMGLAVRVVEICQETRDINGGLISLKELHSRLQETVSVPLSVLEEDILKALALLGNLGNGYEVILINNKKWIKYSAVSGGISNDQKKVYELCEFMGGYVTNRLLQDNYGWDSARLKTIVDEMIMNGFLWIDNQGPDSQWQFWEPSWISK